MKKYLITIAVVAFVLPFSIQANNAITPNSTIITNTQSTVHKTVNRSNTFDGAYIGIGIGGTSTTYKTIDTDFNLVLNMGKNGVDTTVFAGYGMTFSDKFYFGGELLGNYTNRNSTFADNKYRYGIITRLGYLISSTVMVYGTLGSNYSKISFDTNGGNTISKKLFGFAPGVGIETALTHNVLLRTQYINTINKSIKYNDDGDSVMVRLNHSTFILGISYLFT